MTELLTESFCERCGTRYELGTPEPMNRTRKTRGLVTGLRQFILSDTDSLSDSISDAMRAEEEALAAHQIDASRTPSTSAWTAAGTRAQSAGTMTKAVVARACRWLAWITLASSTAG
jgi:hypothetical protein